VGENPLYCYGHKQNITVFVFHNELPYIQDVIRSKEICLVSHSTSVFVFNYHARDQTCEIEIAKSRNRARDRYIRVNLGQLNGKNKPRLTQAAAYIRFELNHMYVRGL